MTSMDAETARRILLAGLQAQRDQIDKLMAFRLARSRLVGLLRQLPRGLWKDAPGRRPWRGLGQRVGRETALCNGGWPPRAPVGWCCYREEDRDAAVIVPLWLFWVRWAADGRWRWYTHRLFLRLGFLRKADEGEGR